MSRQPLGHHGETHRPPGTLGEDDEGGEDPVQIPTPVFSGDFVFLQEIVVEANDGPIVFTGISQDYRHLKLYASLQQYGSSSSHDLWIALADETYMSTEFWYESVTGSGTPNAYFWDANNAAVATKILPGSSFQPFGWALPNSFASVEITIPYYYLEDRRHVVTWQAGALAPTDDEDNVFSLNVGGGSSFVDLSAGVTTIALSVDSPSPGGDNWTAGSIASLYGLR